MNTIFQTVLPWFLCMSIGNAVGANPVAQDPCCPCCPVECCETGCCDEPCCEVCLPGCCDTKAAVVEVKPAVKSCCGSSCGTSCGG